MSEWAAAVLFLAVIAAIIYFWSRSHNSKWRYDQLEKRVNGLSRVKNPDRVSAMLEQNYQLVLAYIAAGDPATAYKAIDLLKTLFGKGAVRKEEALHLTALVIRAMRAKQFDLATAVLDSFRLMLRQLPTDGQPAAVEKLAFISAVALREKQNFLAAKAADILFSMLERADGVNDQAVVAAASRALKLIGVLSLRRRDGGLFRELTTQLAASVLARPESACLRGESINLASVWLYRIIKNDDQAMFVILSGFISRLAEQGVLDKANIRELVKEWQNLAGTASLNHNSLLGSAILEYTLKLTQAYGVLKEWELAVTGVGQVARLALLRHGVKVAFPQIRPILTAGRELLAMELKFGSVETPDSFRQRALYSIVRECLSLAEFAAKQDMVSTAGDAIADFYHCWLMDTETSRKAIKRFCQLLLVYWPQVSKVAKKVAVNSEIAEPVMLREADIQKLSFLR